MSVATAGVTALVSPEERNAFERDGFLLRRGVLSGDEIELVRSALHRDDAIRRRAYQLADGHGGATEICVWNHPGDDTLGRLARLPRTAGVAAELIGGEVYHYHSKVTSKAPGGGGTWAWHQDYGYWYQNGCPRPDMLSIAVAVSEQTKENGCLELLTGSHRCGRLDHLKYESQTAAERQRVDALVDTLPLAHFEAEPGDMLFFHSNTLHRSAPNHSDGAREIVLCCYNRADNDPFFEHHHPRYTPLDIVDDGALRDGGLRMDGEDRSFLDPSTDRSIDGFATVRS